MIDQRVSEGEENKSFFDKRNAFNNDLYPAQIALKYDIRYHSGIFIERTIDNEF